MIFQTSIVFNNQSQKEGKDQESIQSTLQIPQGQIMYFLVNESSPEPLDIATSKFTGA